MSESSDNLLAFLLGAVVGAAAALLLAPEKGEVTRKKIKKSFDELQERGEGMYEEAEKTIEKKAKEIAKLAKNQAEAVKEAFAEGKDAYLKEVKKG